MNSDGTCELKWDMKKILKDAQDNLLRCEASNWRERLYHMATIVQAYMGLGEIDRAREVIDEMRFLLHDEVYGPYENHIKAPTQ